MATCQSLQRKCVVITLNLVDEERIVKYLYEHIYSYNWILKGDRAAGKVRICVWWREDEYKLFSITPLRSFLKRLKLKTKYDKIDITRTMSTDDGVQKVCQGERDSISNYYLEGPLYPRLRELLAFGLSQNPEFDHDRIVHNRIEKDGKVNLIFQIMASLDICTKINLLQKLAASILPEVNQLQHYILPHPPSPLCTEPPSSLLCTEPPSSPLCIEPLSSPLCTEPPSSPLCTEPPSSPLCTEPPSSPLCTEPPSSLLCTEPPPSPLCIEPPPYLPISPLPEFSSSPVYEFNPDNYATLNQPLFN